MKTWMQEMLFVGGVLLAVNYFREGINSLEYIAALAVFLSFGHAQIANRLAEKESKRENPEVECYEKLWWFFISKEVIWCLYFLLSHSYSALAGVGIFLCYPIWRQFYRKNIRPL